MKKRISLILSLILALTLALCACGEKDDGGDAGTPSVSAGGDAQAEADAEYAAPGYVCKFDNGQTVTLGAKAADVLPALGEAADVMEAPSCVHEGTDKVYTYAGLYTINTQPDAAGNDRITEVNLLTDAVALDVNGQYLMIGSDVSEADAAFGEPTDAEEGIRHYSGDNWLIAVADQGGEITGITVWNPMG